MATVNTNISMDSELWNAAKHACVEHRISLAELVRESLRDKLNIKNHKPKRKTK